MTSRTHRYTWPLFPAFIMAFGPVIYMTAHRPLFGLIWLLFAIATIRKTDA